MQLHDRHRNTGFLLRSAMIAVFVCFVSQGVFAAYASALPHTDAYTSLFKVRGVKSSPEIKKPVKLVALPAYAITSVPRTKSSAIDPPHFHPATVRCQSTVPVRAPPAPLSQHIL
jgi:hypothetical protein